MDAVVQWLQRFLLGDRLLLGLIVVPLFMVWELARPVHKTPISHYLFGAKYWVLNLALLTLISPIINISAARVIQYLGFGLIDLSTYGFSGWGGALFALLVGTFIADLFQYWFHRTMHANKYLWQSHLLHHSDEHMNVLTAQRHHFTENLLVPLFVTIPTAILFKLPAVTIGILSLIPVAHQFFAHANVRLHFGPLWWLLASPDFHRIHHSIEPRHQNKNFCNWFPIWDVIFGTAYLPEPDERPETGVEGVEVKTISEAFLLPFTRWWGMFRGRQADKDKGAEGGPAE